MWRESGDPRYLDYIKANVDRLPQSDGTTGYSADQGNIDDIAQGPLLLSLYRRTSDPRYRQAADLLRQQLRIQPRTASGGFCHKRIYPDQMWLDGINMARPFYAEYAALFDDPGALDEVARQIALIAEHTHDPVSGSSSTPGTRVAPRGGPTRAGAHRRAGAH